MIHDALVLLNAAALVYGGVADYRRREIPNAVPVLLLITGILGFSGLWSILGLTVPAVLLFAAAKLTKSEVPGGDFKLLCALGFACGLRELAAILLLAGIGAAIYGFIRRLPVKRHIPLCTYLVPAYIAVQSIAFVIEKTLLL